MRATHLEAKTYHQPHSFFTSSLAQSDPEMAQIISCELARQHDEIELIASENIVSSAVLEAQGSVLTNKYAEGYPAKRYYQGCQHVDSAETLAIERACRLFNCQYANVQPHSGAQANGAVMLALLKPGARILGMALDHGGHLTHGAKPALSGRWFDASHYGVRRSDGLIDYDEATEIARSHHPELIIAGGSAYSRQIDFARFRSIADEVGAYLMVDLAHFSGLVAAGLYPSPFPHAHVVTTTTHKTLRGPRGGMILTNDSDLARKFDHAVFPGLQGGPLMHVVAAKAVALGEALAPTFRDYIHRVILNARVLAETLANGGLDILTGGTDTHLLLVDLCAKELNGKATADTLNQIGIICNKNTIPFDPRGPTVTSGIRLGTPATTTRGFNEAELREVGHIILDTIEAMSSKKDKAIAGTIETDLKRRVKALCDQFPIYTDS